jgi:hypothetical protein
MGTEIDVEAFRLGALTTNKPSQKKLKQVNPFIRGPIPLDWIKRAAIIPRRNALIVGVVLWWLAGMSDEKVGLVLSAKRCKPFGLGGKAVARGLRDLEIAGLVRVNRKKGSSARVDLLQCDSASRELLSHAIVDSTKHSSPPT